MDAYNKMADKEDMKNILSDANNTSEQINAALKYIIQKKHSEKQENTAILEKLLNEHQQ